MLLLNILHNQGTNPWEIPCSQTPLEQILFLFFSLPLITFLSTLSTTDLCSPALFLRFLLFLYFLTFLLFQLVSLSYILISKFPSLSTLTYLTSSTWAQIMLVSFIKSVFFTPSTPLNLTTTIKVVRGAILGVLKISSWSSLSVPPELTSLCFFLFLTLVLRYWPPTPNHSYSLSHLPDISPPLSLISVLI